MRRRPSAVASICRATHVALSGRAAAVKPATPFLAVPLGAICYQLR
jgi:hypothetical protein